MPPDIIFWLALAAKLIVTAGVVVTASLITERVGALAGSLVATLPISAGPAYVILASEHDSAFLADSALMSFATNPAILLYSVAYVRASARYGRGPSLLLALAAWIAASLAIQTITWSIASATIFNAIAFFVALRLVGRSRNAPMPPVPGRWYDIPLRAGLVVALIGAIVLLSSALGPARTGSLAVFPVVFTSLIIILHPRVGGPATAAVIANGISGLIGFAAALLVLHVTVIPYGAPLALLLALLTGMAWNLMMLAFRRSSTFAAPLPKDKAP